MSEQRQSAGATTAPAASAESVPLVPNVATPAGTALGRELARLTDAMLAGKPDNRCATCAFRAGDHLANNSPGTLMDALKCAVEGEPFWCHEHDRACAGWAVMIFPKGRRTTAPWPHAGATDE